MNLEALDVIDANAEDVRFLQATRHGEVLTTVELVENQRGRVERQRRCSNGGDYVRVNPWGSLWSMKRFRRRRADRLLGHFVSEELAEALDRHYVLEAAGDHRRRAAG